ncbi:MBL fold metallo-hydrolase [Arcobacter sp. HD9-500m-PIT-SAG02]|nr:MBL fold metallo-hydrolase [Arcobacter sp. HD9-500m-PIT-SAG02]
MSLIYKIKVSKGIYWIEIDKVDLKILCAAPADSVKYLMKMGLIVKTERDGVKFETGPNAILLSDVLIQNGDICNAAEFPVLQMLYRQGMIVPDHPNNNGTKPMLIGSSDQVQSQLNYIYRGNYGLLSKEEILESDIEESIADDIMRLKLKFAFGKIKNADTFLDTCILDENKIEIKNGVFLKRLEINKFELTYQDESVLIDLNLEGTTGYESPYSLNHFNINRDYFSIIHSGQGDGWNTEQPSMSSILIFQGKIYLVDACPNLDKVLVALGIGINEIEGIFHTHAHDDHFNGLSTLLKSNKKIKYYSTKLVRNSVSKKLFALLNFEANQFEDYFDVIDLEFDKWNNIDGLEVKPILSPHPVENNIFLFRTVWGNGYKSYGHFADLTSFDTLKLMINENENEPGISELNYEKTKEEYLQYVNIKKIDIGGGMIHGNAKDFRFDRSEKIVLAHTSNSSYSEEERIIGSSASFGTVDELIRNNSNFIPRFAKKYLQDLIPSIKENQLTLLLNLKFKTYNPGTILIKGNEKNHYIYLLITGVAETISNKGHVIRTLSSGTLMGDISSLLQLTSSETIRSLSYITVLKIPSKLYTRIIYENNVYDLIEEQIDSKDFLYKTWLFRDEISQVTMNKIVKNIEYKYYKKDHIFNFDCNKLFVILSGSIKRYVCDEYISTLESTDFFNSSIAMFGEPTCFTLISNSACEVMLIDPNVLKEIPIIRWKLFEYNKRIKNIIQHCGTDRNSKFLWKDSYSIHIQVIDNQHKKILYFLNNISNAVQSNNDYNLKENLVSLKEFAQYHFEFKENILSKYNYDIENLANKHESGLQKLYEIQHKVMKDEYFDRNELLEFLSNWVDDHIIQEEQEYSSYLNSKNIF